MCPAAFTNDDVGHQELEHEILFKPPGIWSNRITHLGCSKVLCVREVCNVFLHGCKSSSLAFLSSLRSWARAIAEPYLTTLVPLRSMASSIHPSTKRTSPPKEAWISSSPTMLSLRMPNSTIFQQCRNILHMYSHMELPVECQTKRDHSHKIQWSNETRSWNSYQWPDPSKNRGWGQINWLGFVLFRSHYWFSEPGRLSCPRPYFFPGSGWNICAYFDQALIQDLDPLFIHGEPEIGSSWESFTSKQAGNHILVGWIWSGMDTNVHRRNVTMIIVVPQSHYLKSVLAIPLSQPHILIAYVFDNNLIPNLDMITWSFLLFVI